MLREKLNANKPKKEESLDLSLSNCPSSDVSKYFPNLLRPPPALADRLVEIQNLLNQALRGVNFLKSPVEYVYNPTEYARAPFEMFTRKYSHPNQTILIVGMNPGPFGMCQTGVPFGDTDWVKNWLRIEARVEKPTPECPQRPVQGFGCTRRERSGDRFWKFWSETCTEPRRFFENAYVYNYCPLAFMGGSGKNLTPAEIKDCKQLEAICDKSYQDVLEVFGPQIVIAMGRYVEKRTKTVLKSRGGTTKLLCMPHPSPRAKNNHDWPQKALGFLQMNNLVQYFHK